MDEIKKRKKLIQRIEDRIFYSPDGCWYWIGALWSHSGRGRIQVWGKSRIAYRVIYQLQKGSIPEGKMLCHRCDNPVCVNPDHLFVGTAKDNFDDFINKGKIRPVFRGEKNGSAKLSDKDVLEIRSLRGKCTNVELAKRFKTNDSHISMIQRRQLWTHI